MRKEKKGKSQKCAEWRKSKGKKEAKIAMERGRSIMHGGRALLDERERDRDGGKRIS